MSQDKKINAVRRYADGLIDRSQSEANMVSEAIFNALGAADGEPPRSQCALVVASLGELKRITDEAIIEVTKAAHL